MRPGHFKYLMVYTIPLVVALSVYASHWYTFTAVITLFVLVPVLELFTSSSVENMSQVEEEVARKDKVYDWIVFGLVPVQYLLLVYFLYRVSSGDGDAVSLVGQTLAMGIACGVLGINAAHELGHRTGKKEQLLAKMLLLTSLYMHFFIEHNRGHHKRASTMEDPASARYGESVYRFYFRSIIGSWRSAWEIEKKLLLRQNRRTWSIHNEMLLFSFLQLMLLAAVGLLFGGTALLCFLGSAIIGILLLETVNYIEHYGLARKKHNDQYERMMPAHSWNSSHPLGRMMLLELTRHSDHHYLASRKYQLLRHFDHSPQMPAGYPGMMFLALIPPLWFKVMNRQIKRYRNTEAGMALA